MQTTWFTLLNTEYKAMEISLPTLLKAKTMDVTSITLIHVLLWVALVPWNTYIHWKFGAIIGILIYTLINTVKKICHANTPLHWILVPPLLQPLHYYCELLSLFIYINYSSCTGHFIAFCTCDTFLHLCMTFLAMSGQQISPFFLGNFSLHYHWKI